MKTLLVIGIGAGNPDHLTLQALQALNRADVFLLFDKGPAKHGLNDLRRDVCTRFATQRPWRFVEADNPERPPDGDSYRGAVRQLNDDKQQVIEQLIAHHVAEGECAGILVWGDPALYDSTLRILQAILAAGRVAFEYQVIPGITSVQALTASHRVPLNEIGGSVHISPGRQLPAHVEPGDSQVVMLDAHQAFNRLRGQGLFIWWGAYVGSPEELLIAGPLDEVADEIVRVREEARARHGWMMDSYLLRHV
ncbi:precorrin 6A synthase [Pseudomonas sp. M47T1]|uniref:precorrin-6A synthase (deacetylating) n=1 Tax=unclassified Pseudomonas TaxID=196821 RepID=UPI0002607DDE|nr:precorrin-6A synthase (deacetylating) [Pseudomonas sp. M47T1]EIK94128.1 precorrin 6A synthase [Pseudomonas sp. M47T1]